MLHSDVQRITVHCIDTIKFVKTDTCVQSEKRLDSNGGCSLHVQMYLFIPYCSNVYHMTKNAANSTQTIRDIN